MRAERRIRLPSTLSGHAYCPQYNAADGDRHPKHPRLQEFLSKVL